MSECHLFNSIQQIYYSQDIHPIIGYFRYLKWQYLRLIHCYPERINISKSRIVAYLGSGVAPLVYWMGRYDFNNMGFIQELLKNKKGLFIDVGANIGTYTLIASEIDTAQIYSFEPHPQTYKLLEENIKANNRKNVSLYNFAVTNCRATVNFSDYAENAINKIIMGVSSSKDSIIVNSIPLDMILLTCEIQPIYLKIDVEGFDKEVLEGSSNSLQKISIIQIESGECNEVKNFLNERGFLGPFYVNIRKKTLKKNPRIRKEDPIYMQQCVITELLNIGWKFDR